MEIFEQVKDIIVETLGCDDDKVTMECAIKDDLGADSLDAVELNMALEEAFHITIEEDALANFVTVKNIVDYIEGQQK